MSRHRIGTPEEFPEGQGVPVTVQGVNIAVFKLDDAFYAVLDNCRHKNLPLHECGHGKNGEETGTKGKIDYENRIIHCPWHNLEWDLRTGDNAALDTSIPVYDITVENREVYIEL